MPTSTHPTAQTGMPPRGGGRTLLHWVSISLRRGGRPCPPAENARFCGNPMRIRNILTGRCGHRPLQTTAENRRILKGGQGRPPLQMKFDRPFVSSNPVHQISVVPRYFRRGKSSGFANAGRIREIYILRRRGRCPHRPAERTRFMVLFRRIRVDFPFCTVGADGPVRPPELSGFTEIRCEIAIF